MTGPMMNAGDHVSWTPVKTSEVWLISANEALAVKIKKILRPYAPALRVLAPEMAGEHLEAALREAEPALILIDIGVDIDWGMRVIQAIKRTLTQSPAVILTERFSREFGVKILSEGIHYYFPHDFCKSEFSRLVKSILKPVRGSRKTERGI